MARYDRSRSREHHKKVSDYGRDDSCDSSRGQRDRQRSRYNDARDDSRHQRDDSRHRQRGRTHDSDRGRNDHDRQRNRGRDRDQGDDARRRREYDSKDSQRVLSPDRDRRERRDREDNERRVDDSDEGKIREESQREDRTEQASKPNEEIAKSDVPDWVRDLVDPAPQSMASPASASQRVVCIPEQFVSKVLGYQRCIINEIQTTTQTSIHMNQNLGRGCTVATIISTVPGAVEKAEAMINARIEAGLKTQVAYAQGYHGMGKGGKATLTSGGFPLTGIKM